MSSNKPTRKIKVNNISLSEWENERGKSYTLQKSYKGKDGNWVNQTLSLFLTEIGSFHEISDKLRENKWDAN